MISTGRRGWRACTASISAMPSVGAMRRSTQRQVEARVVHRAEGLLGVRGGRHLEAHGHQPHLEHLDDGEVVVDDQNLALHGRRRSSLRSICLRLLEVGPQTVGLGLPRGQLLAGAHQVALAAVEIVAQLGQLRPQLHHLGPQPRQLLPRHQHRRQGVATLQGPRRRGGVGIAREVLIVGGDRLLPRALAGLVIGAGEQRDTAAGERPGRAAGGRRHQQQHGGRAAHRSLASRDGVPSRGISTVKRLPLPSWDSTVTRPPCASTRARTIASPRPVPPRPA